MTNRVCLGRVYQQDARNYDYAMWHELSGAERERAMSVEMRAYASKRHMYAKYTALDGIVAFAFMSTVNLMRTHRHGLTVKRLYALTKAQYVSLGGDLSEGGGSLLACAQVLRTRKVIKRYVWDYSLGGVLDWMMAGRGPIILGCDMYDLMLKPDAYRRVMVGGFVIGGAALVLYRVDRHTSMISAFTPWPFNTTIILPFEHVEFLLERQGEALGLIT